MPGGDRTGPGGEGPRTGRGMGDCPTGVTAGWTPRRGFAPWYGWGRGWGMGRGFGGGMAWRRGFGVRGWRRPAAPWPTAEEDAAQELDMLESQANWLQQGLDEIRARMDDLKGRGEPQE